MPTHSYLKFKAGAWAKVDDLPDWVTNNDPTYTEGRALSHESDRTYYEKEIWVGESLKYMMKWEPVAQKDLELVGMYAKIK
jgi:hypothetical protein